MRSEYVAKAARKYIGITILFLFISLLIFLALYGPRLWNKRELDINRAKWKTQNITHYRFNLNIHCFYISLWDRMPVTIEVHDGQLVSIVDFNGRAWTQESSGFYTLQKVDTVEKLFFLIQKGLAEADVAIPEFDSKYGFPNYIYIDWNHSSIDDESTHIITNFEVLP